VAYCRWLSARYAADITLPTEQEWEKAARGTQGLDFPWGALKVGFANIREFWIKQAHYLGQTSAVGIYPQGQSPFGLSDIAGNVWEWCLNEYEQPRRTGTKGEAYRVVRGGAWLDSRGGARCACRFGGRPDLRSGYLGFRVVLRSPLLP